MPALNTISYPSSSNNRGSNNVNARRSIRSALDGWSERVYQAVHRWRWPTRERNLIAAFFTLLSLTVLSAALADEEWVYLEGGKCGLKHIGVSLFYGWGYFQHRSSMEQRRIDGRDEQLPKVHIVYTVGGRSYFDCVNPTIADVFHALMGVLFVAVATTMGSFFLDTFGVKQGFLAWLRRNSIFSIFSVIFCVIVIGLTYWISVEIEQQQRDSVPNPDAVKVSFEDGFYLVIAGAAFSICAIIANLVKSSMQIKRRCDDRLSLLENIDGGIGNGVGEHGGQSNAAASRENLLHYYHHYRRRLLNLPMTANNQLNLQNSNSNFGNPIGATNSIGGPLLIAERPIGSTGPPPPLQMILNVPPPPPYSP